MPSQITSAEILSLTNGLQTRGALLQTKKVTAGFDGFVDTIAKVIKNRHEHKEPEFFQSIESFGKYALEKKAGSFSVEVEERSVKIGGNMPILANALGSLGVHVNCIGALGFPRAQKIFDTFPGSCKKFSFAEPGTSTAYEFNDGKMMFGNMGDLNTLGWEIVRDRIGLDTLTALHQQSDLLCMVNWSEIEASGNIWRGFLDDVVRKNSKPNRQQRAFFDLSDCSKRSDESIREVLLLITEFGPYCKVALGLNKNEASKIYQALFGNVATDLISAGKNIFEKLGIKTLLIHHSREAIAISEQGIFTKPSFFVEHPKLSTGAGDNFNAGFNAAQLLNLKLSDCLILAHAASGYYITNGQSPQLNDIVNFLTQKK